MAHNLEIINGEAQMAYRASAGKPWHGLGTPVGDDMTPFEMMEVAGLNWEVEKVDTFYRYKGDNQVSKLWFVPPMVKFLLRLVQAGILFKTLKLSTSSPISSKPVTW